MKTKIKVNTNSKIQPKGKTTGIFKDYIIAPSRVIAGNEYECYKLDFLTKEGKKVSGSVPVDMEEGSLFRNFLEAIDIQFTSDEQGEYEIDIESALEKEVGLDIEHTPGKAIVFANVISFFSINDEQE